jgi:hypothetical protein
VHCARCHDHKFDPISQDEYYALQAVFAGVDKANRLVDMDPKVATRRRELEELEKRIPQMLSDASPELLDAELQAQVQQWESDEGPRALAWKPLELVEFTSGGGAALKLLDDQSVLASGPRADKDIYTLRAQVKLSSITALRLEVLPDESLPSQGPGRNDNGNLHLNDLKVFLVERDDPPSWRPLDFAGAKADFDQTDWTIAMAVDKNPNSAWGVFPEVGKPHEAVFELREPLASAEETVTLRIEMHQLHGGGHLIGRFRLTATDAAAPLSLPSVVLPADVARCLTTPADERTEEQRRLLAAHYLKENIARERGLLPQPESVYCGTSQFLPDGSFRPAEKPRPVHVLQRGIVTQPLHEAHPGALACIENLSYNFATTEQDAEGQRRLALARWLSDPGNGLTWRTITNRIWQYHFGRGLVDTPNDFGQMGSSPTHPELLDWLSLALQENHDSLKDLHRLIVTSSVYRQASAHRPDCALVDADNRLLWRMNRGRLDAESFRDALLVLSGSLDARMGGASARQFIQSPGIHVTPNVDYLSFDVDDPANYRRSVYRFIFRTLPDPFMDALDCPDASQLTPKRNVSVTALQAMATLNDKFVVRQSALLAERIAAQAPTADQQVVAAYRLILGREPTAEEAALVRVYLDRQGLANTCRFLVNTNEFVFVD